ncbi:ParA family protein [Microbacterium dauci]|uniref:ParA family protein n=1 Tax=Microbacterium dauci TaxID=3048008 RepID=A0ABT6ZB31_9MICO|nr:ParA family protein [Microbacterium sp. LX3-4]MDJ1113143.1 ParA family protein [Microbacterium sp. LX3-4]
MSTASEAPHVRAHVSGETATFTGVDGHDETFTADDVDGLRRLIVDRVRTDAATSNTTIELHTSGDRGAHELLVGPDGELIAIYDDRTLTRAEVRQHVWWTTDPVVTEDDDVDDDDARDAEVAGDATQLDRAASAVEAPARSGFDPGDDDDIDEDTFTSVSTSSVSVPQFFLPAPVNLARVDPPAAESDSEPAAEAEPEPDTAAEASDDWAAPRVTEIPADGPVEVQDDESVEVAADRAAPSTVAAFAPDVPGDEAPTADTIDAAPSHSPMNSGIGDSLPDVPMTASTAIAADAIVRPRFIEPAPEHPATVTGWRAFFAKLGFPVGPSQAELERAAREKAVSRQWAGCRAIAVANGKGGVGKTMTTAVLSAVFARHGGGNVLAWDNNDTRGTLGWRTEQGDYDSTIRDLLPHARQLLEATASVSDISRFVHHQSIDRYDVLRSNPELLAADQRITTADFDLLAQVAARYYRMVIFDSGNDESADRWLRMIDSAHQLVVPTLAAPESAESAALLLDALRKRDAHSRRLAEGAVVIVGQSEKSSAAAVQEIAAGFEGHVRAVQIIPFDDALKAGRIRYDALQPKTRDAWMRAAAAVADGL